MALPLKNTYAPMDAKLEAHLPEGAAWQYEPKWDGFRCLVFRDGKKVELQSKGGQPLARYFPELVEAFLNVGAKQFVVDGEIVVPEEDGKTLSFDALLQRIHPAESRIKKLAKQTPSIFIAFDLLVNERGKLFANLPLTERRKALNKFAAKYFKKIPSLRLSTATTTLKTAKDWLTRVGAQIDGVIAKRLDVPYQSGLRTGMIKVKRMRTADCVVGGFRYAAHGGEVGSLLLGLYDENGLLHHVGFSSAFTADERKKLKPKLEVLIEPPGFTGSAPGGPSRWSTERSVEWKPLRPELVVEVRYDHFSGGRFRHGTKLLRWRPDKAPRQCKMTQVEQESRVPLKHFFE